MARTLTQMSTKVGNMVRDTSTTFITLIEQWINDAYHIAEDSTLWAVLIDDDFTFESVVDQAEYSFVTDMSITDFGEEIAVVNIEDGRPLERMQIKTWWEQRGGAFQSDAIPSGTPKRYVILDESGTLKLDPTPDKAQTYAMPYKKKLSDLTTSDTSTIVGLDRYLEYRATSDAFAYKKKFTAATFWNNKAETELRRRIKDEKVKVNQIYSRLLANYDIQESRPLTGWQSYNDL